MGVESLSERLRIKPERAGRARSLRREMTFAEQRMWNALRSKQINHLRFRRQHPIGPYIADFACISAKLIIEIDGGQHQEQAAYDERRTAFLQQQGWRVLRFWSNDVLSNLEGVLAKVANALTATPHPGLPPERGKEWVSRWNTEQFLEHSI